MGDPPTPVLTSRRLSFETLDERDAAESASAMTPEVARWLVSFPASFSAEDAKARIQASREQISSGEAMHFALRLLADRSFVGWSSAWRTDRKGEWELGFWIGERFQGRGLGYEAQSALLGHLIATTSLRSLRAMAHPGNLRSISILRKLGMSQTGETSRFVAFSGEEHPFLIFTLRLAADL